LVSEWTEKAKQYIENGEYRYFSPVLGISKDGKVIGMRSIAITNTPALHGVDKLAAKDDDDENGEILDSFDDTVLAEGNENKQEEGVVSMKLTGILNLADDADTAVIEKAVLELSEAKVALEGEVEALKEQVKEKDAEAAVAQALSDGKLSESMKGWATSYAKSDIKGFSEWIKVAQPVVPVNDVPQAKQHEDVKQFSEVQKEVAGLFGNAPEEVYN